MDTCVREKEVCTTSFCAGETEEKVIAGQTGPGLEDATRSASVRERTFVLDVTICPRGFDRGLRDVLGSCAVSVVRLSPGVHVCVCRRTSERE